jgi:ribosomal protein S18 acetylase RimI-like enzyme
MQIGPLVESDLGAAFALSEAEGWNQTVADWQRLLELEPTGCFAARDGHRLIGTVTTTTYERGLSWIGMTIVDREARGQGIGAALMQMALAYLQDRESRDIRLDATPAGRPLYESLGFVVDSEFERWQGTIAPAPRAKVGAQNQSALSMMFTLDRDAYGVSRRRLLERLAAERVAMSAIANTKGEGLEGYALARRGRIATYVGPIVASTVAVAEQLLDDVFGEIAKGPVCLDLHLGGWLPIEALTVRGMSKRRALTRMRHGEATLSPTSPSICASAGPEYG